MNIALTGSSGLIGSAVWTRLRASHTIRTIGKRPTADLVADLSDTDAIAKLDLRGCDTLVHCAGIVDEDFQQDPSRAFRQATLGMAALVKLAKSTGIQRFLYLSTAHVYGHFSGRITEASAPNPLSDYAIAHFASEQIVRRAASDMFRVTVVRPCAVFGIPADIQHFRRWSLIPFGFPKMAIEKGYVELKSSGMQRRNFVATDDIAAAMGIWLADCSTNPFMAINPIGKQSMTVLEFAHLCARVGGELTGKPCAVRRPDGTDPPQDTFEYATTDARYIGSSEVEDVVRCLMNQLIRAAQS